MHTFLLKKTIFLIILLFSACLAFAKEPSSEQELTSLQKEARVYRDQGLACQNRGNLDTALNFYQKAVELDSGFAIAYNDLGVVLEAKGQIDRAEAAYRRAIAIDPAYLSSYTNLALLYEEKREIAKAAECWKKRANLGSQDDPWTKNAGERFEELSLILSKTPLEDLKEKEVLGLTEKMSKPRTMFTHEDASLAYKHMMKANEYFERREFAAAVKEALDAQQFDPTNKEIEKFIEKVQLRALSE